MNRQGPNIKVIGPILLSIAFLVVTVFAVSSFGASSDPNSRPAVLSPNYASTKLLGDWAGERTKLAENGVTFDFFAIQTYQGVVEGGINEQWKYGGLMNSMVKLDFEKMGLWKGAFMEIGAENQFGEFINMDTGAIIPVNTIGVIPQRSYDICLDRVVFRQFFTETFGIYFGKLLALTETLGDWNELAGGKGFNQFMNLNFVFNPVLVQTVPYSSFGGGVFLLFPDLGYDKKMPGQIRVSVRGANGQPGQWPEDDFDKGTATVGELYIPTKFFQMPGGQLFGATYSSREFTALSQDPRLSISDLLGGGSIQLNLKEHDGSSCFYYNFYQYLVSEEKDPMQGWGLFGRFGVAPEETNPISNFYSIGLGGKGTFEGRDKDEWGLGYFYVKLSEGLGPLVLSRLGDSQGVEMFYNIAVTDWMHITPDLQIINPVDKLVDTTYVAGFRARIDF